MTSPNRYAQRIKSLVAEYGPVAIGVYLVLWAGVLVGFGGALLLGFEPEGASGTGGILFASWIAVKLTQPARLALTAVLTPVVARWLPSSRPR
jgi:hypothetical protein